MKIILCGGAETGATFLGHVCSISIDVLRSTCSHKTFCAFDVLLPQKSSHTVRKLIGGAAAARGEELEKNILLNKIFQHGVSYAKRVFGRACHNIGKLEIPNFHDVAIGVHCLTSVPSLRFGRLGDCDLYDGVQNWSDGTVHDEATTQHGRAEHSRLYRRVGNRADKRGIGPWGQRVRYSIRLSSKAGLCGQIVRVHYVLP